MTLLVLFFTACCKENTFYGDLLRAEMLVNDYPDSALQILRHEIDPGVLAKNQYADWCFLLTKTKDKCYVKHTSDSLINFVVDFYESTHNTKNLMEAYYYMGRVSHDTENELRAQDYYLRALAVSENSADYATLGRICNNLGTLYTNLGTTEIALPYYEKALFYLAQLNDTVSQSFILRNMGRIYSLENNLDSAIIYYEQALPYANFRTYTSIMNELGMLYTKKGDYQSALAYLQACIGIVPESQNDHVCLNLGSLYLEMGKKDSARMYLTRSLESNYLPTKASANYNLSRLAKEEKNWEDAASLLSNYVLLSDSILKTGNKESIRRVQKLHDYHRTETQISQMKLSNSVHQKNLYQLLFIIVVLIVLIMVFFMFAGYGIQKSKRKEQKANKLLEKLENENKKVVAKNEQRIKELEIEIAESRSRESRLAQSEIKKLVLENQQLAHAQYQRELLITQLKKTDIYKKIHLSQAQKLSDSDKDKLMEAIGEAYPNFFPALLSACPNIKEDELFMCTLYKADVKSLKAIGSYMSLTNQAIAMKRNRLYVKIFNRKGDPKLFDDFIESL